MAKSTPANSPEGKKPVQGGAAPTGAGIDEDVVDGDALFKAAAENAGDRNAGGGAAAGGAANGGAGGGGAPEGGIDGEAARERVAEQDDAQAVRIAPGVIGNITALSDSDNKAHTKAARQIAFFLLGIVSVTIVLQYVRSWIVLCAAWPADDQKLTAFKEVAAFFDRLYGVLLPVLAGLVGSAVTYYFAKERR